MLVKIHAPTDPSDVLCTIYPFAEFTTFGMIEIHHTPFMYEIARVVESDPSETILVYLNSERLQTISRAFTLAADILDQFLFDEVTGEEYYHVDGIGRWTLWCMDCNRAKAECVCLPPL